MKPKDTLSETRLLELIETYGADIETWPETEADAARVQLAAPSDAIAKALAGASELDALLAQTPSIEPPEHLYQAILDAAPAPDSRRVGLGAWIGWRAWGGRLAAAASALAMGLTLGLGTAAASAPTEDPFSEAGYFGFEMSDFAADLEELPE